MVEGLQIDVPSEELKRIVAERAEHHATKAATYEAKAKDLQASIKDIEDDLEFGKTSMGATPAASLLNKAREHKDKAIHFKFILEHVIQNDTYRLGQNDLRLLGIATAHHY
jgi:hypothetical protein